MVLRSGTAYSCFVSTPETVTRSRTRQAIIDAAITVLASDPGASLADIAAAAGVGRTTLHRYFAERQDLLSTLATEIAGRLAEADRRAKLEDGTGLEATLRLVREYHDLGDALSFMFAGQVDVYAAFSAVAAPCTANSAIARGMADGSLDDQLTPEWVESMMWSALYSAWAYTNEHGGSRHESLRLVVRSLEGAVGRR